MTDANFARIGKELQEARSAEGGPYQNTVPMEVRNYFQSALAFGGTATSQLLQSGPSLRSLELVLDMPAGTTLTGDPAVNPGAFFINNLQMQTNGRVFVNLSGAQVFQLNKGSASINGLQSLEISDGTNQTLAQRKVMWQDGFKYIIHLPCPCDDTPIPYSKFASPIQVQLTLNTVNNILEGGTGTCALANAYIIATFLTVPSGTTNVDEDTLALVQQAPNGVDNLIQDHYFMQYSLLAGVTTATLQLNQLRNFVGLMTFYIVRTADLQTAGDYKPQNYLPISTFQMVLAGNNIFSQQPVDADVHRRYVLPRSGLLNYTDELLYGIGFEGGFSGSDHQPIDIPYGGGLFIGASGVGSPELQLTFPALPANCTCFVNVTAWNAVRYTAAGNGQLNMTAVLN